MSENNWFYFTHPKGISKFYERTEDRESFLDALRHIADIHAHGYGGFCVCIKTYRLSDLNGGTATKSNDVNKCAETLHRYIEGRREARSRKQVRSISRRDACVISSNLNAPLKIVEALCLLLPDSRYHPVLSHLPAPDLTHPAATTTLVFMQSAVHNSLPVLEEIVDLLERDEVESVKKEVENRRQRLGETRGPEQLRKAVEFEVLGASQVRFSCV